MGIYVLDIVWLLVGFKQFLRPDPASILGFGCSNRAETKHTIAAGKFWNGLSFKMVCLCPAAGVAPSDCLLGVQPRGQPNFCHLHALSFCT